MGAYEILAPLLGIGLVVFLVSQCLLPEIAGTPWFPMLRRVWKLRQEVSQVEEQQVEKSLEQHLAEMRKTQTTTQGEDECPEEPQPTTQSSKQPHERF